MAKWDIRFLKNEVQTKLFLEATVFKEHLYHTTLSGIGIWNQPILTPSSFSTAMSSLTVIRDRMGSQLLGVK